MVGRSVNDSFPDLMGLGSVLPRSKVLDLSLTVRIGLSFPDLMGLGVGRRGRSISQ